MLAVAWNWQEPDGALAAMSERLAASLCAGIGGRAAARAESDVHVAYRPLRSELAALWRPARLEDGRLFILHGAIDNAPSLALDLGVSANDHSALYARAVARWGDEADRHVIGDYCSVVADPAGRRLRLARSPFRAPPLHYAQDRRLVAAASVPRALFAATIDRRLNEARVADSALLNFANEEETWFEGVLRVPLGHVVTLEPGRERRLHRYYDPLALPALAPASDADLIARTGELMDEAVRTALAGSRRPGVTLSGGLDSPQAAVRALKALPPEQHLPTFTFHPETGWDGAVTRGGMGSERAAVEAFAAMHPRLEPHFTDNAGYGHDHRWDQMFHLMAGAPSGLPNMYVFHGLFAAARERGCDLLLTSDWGNMTFSDRGGWGFAEFLATGRWKELWLALKHNAHDHRSLPRRFLALSLAPLLPPRLFAAMQRLVHGDDHSPVDLISPLNRTYREQSGAEGRLQAATANARSNQPRDRRDAIARLLANADSEAAETYQAFEQLYGIRQRDPFAYRPLVEFCFALPTRMFLRGGETRWLAKQLAKGIMPEEQRANVLNGKWDADWHLRIRRRRDDYLAQLDRLAGEERHASMLDIARLRQALEHLPDATPTDRKTAWTLQLGLPRLLMTAHFVDFIEGRNR